MNYTSKGRFPSVSKVVGVRHAVLAGVLGVLLSTVALAVQGEMSRAFPIDTIQQPPTFSVQEPSTVSAARIAETAAHCAQGLSAIM